MGRAQGGVAEELQLVDVGKPDGEVGDRHRAAEPRAAVRVGRVDTGDDVEHAGERRPPTRPSG